MLRYGIGAMRKIHVHLLAVAIAVAAAGLTWILWLRDYGSTSAAPAGRPGSATSGSATLVGTTSTPAGSGSGSAAAAGPPQVRRLSTEERRVLGDQIAAAVKKARPAPAPGQAAAAAADPIIPLEEVGKELHHALEDALPLLADCFPKGSSAMATAMMQMTSDPELGTVIDTDEVKGADGSKLDAKLDACLRDAIDELALPPLGKPGKLKLQYTFQFDHDQGGK